MVFYLLLTSPYNLRANSLQTGSDCVVCVRSKWARMMNECVVGGALMSGGWGSGNVVVGVGLGRALRTAGSTLVFVSHRPLTLYALERSWFISHEGDGQLR